VTNDQVRFCQNGSRIGFPHEFGYNGRVQQIYTCRNCTVLVSKRELKEKTDA